MILRPVNLLFNLAAALLILAAALYTWDTQAGWGNWLLHIIGVLVALFCGAWYGILRYELDESGISRRSLFGTTRIPWGPETKIDLQEERTEETARLSLTVTRGSLKLCLSSDVLSLEQMEELVAIVRQKQQNS